MDDNELSVPNLDRLILERDDYKERWEILGRVAKRVMDRQAEELAAAVEERDAYAKLVALYREYGSPDLTRLVNHEAMRTPPAGSTRITTSRTEAGAVECPRCGARPGQPCVGARLKPRVSMHRERHQALGQ